MLESCQAKAHVPGQGLQPQPGSLPATATEAVSAEALQTLSALH